MRDNHQGLPEIVAVGQRDGERFGIVALTIDGETRSIEFGLVPAAYDALKRVLQMRPFDTMPGVSYRYFYVPSFRRIPERETFEVEFRVEQGQSAKQFALEIPECLAANLEWFRTLPKFSDTSHLRFVPYDGSRVA